jgi:putative YphP/YqiW family bacilliredoxin
MPYPEMLIAGMRNELAILGIEETKSPEQVIEAIEKTDGTVMVIVNSVCGCAAGGVRPGIATALQNDATDVARDYFTGFSPSSPSIGILKDGKLVKMFERRDLEGRPPQMIADNLVNAFNEVCAKTEAANN